MTDDFIVTNPVFPCLCGHLITAHGEFMDKDYRYEWDDDHKEEVRAEYDVARPVCYECKDKDCPFFVEMTNLEYVEFKSGNDKRQ